MRILKNDMSACDYVNKELRLCTVCLRNKEGKPHRVWHTYKPKINKTTGVNCVGFLFR